MLHAEVSVDAFGTALRLAGDDVTLTVVDPATERVVFDAGVEARGPRELRDAAPYIAAAVDSASLGRAEEVDGVRTLSEHLPPVTGNANQWVVVAGSPPVGAFGLGSFDAPAIALVVGGLLLVALTLVIVRRTRRDAADRMAIAEQRRRVAERQSRTDLLTGLLNRRGFGERLHAELARASREGGAAGAAARRRRPLQDRQRHATATPSGTRCWSRSRAASRAPAASTTPSAAGAARSSWCSSRAPATTRRCGPAPSACGPPSPTRPCARRTASS